LEVDAMNPTGKEYEQIIEKAAQLGYENELKYFGCSQAVVSSLIEAFGIGGPDILRASTALAGGIARRGNVCGALAGGLMMVGLLVGRDDLEMNEQYQRGQLYGDKLYRKFEEKFGTAICAEIQKMKFGKTFDMLTEKGRELFIESGAHDPEGCPLVTGEGARLAAELMVEILKEGRAMARIVARE
jgi:C_GCAxxG_C_C family probable redox protein